MALSNTASRGRQNNYVFGPGGALQNAPTENSNPLQRAYELKDVATRQQAEDYDSIMQGYKNSLSNGPAAIGMPSPYTPETYAYKPSASFTGAMSNMENLSQTGGYSQQDISDLRARGVSPIRAIYANAQRDMDRNRRLSGGFSPNYNASKVKLARELSSIIGDKVTDVNAGIAQNVAGNKVQLAPQRGALAAGENNMMNDIGRQNTGIMNDAQKFNIQMPLDISKFNAGLQGNQLDALRGMTSLYGTTPALTNTFGNQALQAAQLQQQQQQQNSQTEQQGYRFRKY